MIFTPCLIKPEAPFTVSGTLALILVVTLDFEFEVVRFRRVELFSFSFSSNIPKKSLGLFCGDPVEVEGRREPVDEDLCILELCNLGRLNLDGFSVKVSSLITRTESERGRENKRLSDEPRRGLTTLS